MGTGHGQIQIAIRRQEESTRKAYPYLVFRAYLCILVPGICTAFSLRHQTAAETDQSE